MATPTRWRKVKSANKPKQNIADSKREESQSQWIKLSEFSLKKQLHLMYASERIKAFITDMFMINMPLLYLTTYVFLDGKEAFTHNQNVIFACGIGYGVILSLFFAFTSQTPGYRYMCLKLVRYNSHQSYGDEADSKNPPFLESQVENKADSINNINKVSFIRSFVRYVVWVFGTSFLFGLLIGIFRKDGRCLHDILCKTQVVSIISQN